MTLGRFVDQLAKIVTHPTSNLTGAVILLAMVVLVLLILAIAALITILPAGGDDDGETAAEARRPAKVKVAARAAVRERGMEPSRRARLLAAARDRGLAFALPAVLVLAGLVWGWGVTSEPQRCGSCHAVAAAQQTWSAGDHRTVGCVACHEDGGVGIVPAAAYRVSDLAVSLRSGEATIDGAARPVPSYRCSRCHADIEKGVRQVGAVKVSHREFLDAGYACARCHADVGHTRADAPERAVSMTQCVGCHDGRIAASACNTCHVGDPSSAVRVDRSLFVKVDIPQPAGCTGCHETKTCLACHGIVMPHPPGFETGKGHAALAVFEKKDRLCYRCHTPQDCKQCHKGDFTTHGPNWKTQHPSGLPLDGRNACACHSTPNFCGLCHETSKP